MLDLLALSVAGEQKSPKSQPAWFVDGCFSGMTPVSVFPPLCMHRGRWLTFPQSPFVSSLPVIVRSRKALNGQYWRVDAQLGCWTRTW